MEKTSITRSKSGSGDKKTSFLLEIQRILGVENVISEKESLEQTSTNSLGLHRRTIAALFPRSVEDVESIVYWANQFRIGLHPVSRGMNLGYGSKTPWSNDQVIVSLEKMNKITDFDPVAGEVTVEPGVTQQQLYEFLKENGDQWIADVTGAPTTASVLGNTLDGGFGHTPIGNHREHILEIEAVLGNGERLKTGRFPCLGPNMAPLFVQSNLGIVTSLRLPLMKRPECVSTYTLQFYTHEDFKKALPIIAQLKHEKVIESLIHIANATRLCMSTRTFPKDLPKEVRLDDNDCLKLMRLPLLNPSLWTAVGGLYGTRKHVQRLTKELKLRLKGVSKVQVFDEKKFSKIEKIVKIIHRKSSPHREPTLKSIASLRSLNGLAKGIPTDEPFKNILWRTDNLKDMGLIWCSPVIEAKAVEINKLIGLAGPIFESYGFELPITTTLIDHKHLVCVINISFDRSNKDETLRAHKAYKELSQALAGAEIQTYRLSLLSQGQQLPSERLNALRGIKRQWDPRGIIAPGKYGI